MFRAQVIPGPERARSKTENKEDEKKASEEEKDVFQNASNHSTVTDFARFLG
jgi:hypothetical protein